MGLPILLEFPDSDPKNADGFIFRRGPGTAEAHSWLAVRLVPPEILESVQKSKAGESVETPYGTVSRHDRAKLLEMNLLLQSILSGDEKALRRYVALQAADEASAKLRAIRYSLNTEVEQPIAGVSPAWGDSPFSALLSPANLRSVQNIGLRLEHERLEKDLPKQIIARITKPGHPVAELIRELNQLAYARLVLWWQFKERRLEAGLLCRSSRSALFALLLSRAAMPKGTAVCARCSTVFTRVRIGQKFCSKRCRYTYLKARQRARLKEK